MASSTYDLWPDCLPPLKRTFSSFLSVLKSSLTSPKAWGSCLFWNNIPFCSPDWPQLQKSSCLSITRCEDHRHATPHHGKSIQFNVFLLHSHYFLTLYFQCFFWSFPSTMDILSRYSNTWPRKKGTKPNTNVHPAVTDRAPPGFQFWRGTRRGSSSMHFCIYGGFYPKEFLWKYFLQW